MNDLLASGKGEIYKGTVHLGLFTLAAICGAYNLGAAVVRPHPRLFLNVALYGALAAFEATQVHGHWSDGPAQ